MRRIEDDVVNFVLRVEDAGENFLFIEAQVDMEIVVVARENF